MNRAPLLSILTLSQVLIAEALFAEGPDDPSLTAPLISVYCLDTTSLILSPVTVDQAAPVADYVVGTRTRESVHIFQELDDLEPTTGAGERWSVAMLLKTQLGSYVVIFREGTIVSNRRMTDSIRNDVVKYMLSVAPLVYRERNQHFFSKLEASLAD
jgi:hypothetical protein